MAETLDATFIDIDLVIPYENNPRLNAKAIKGTCKSLQEFGWQQPIVCDEQMVILAGHTRLICAKKLGYKTVPVHIARGLTSEQCRMYRLIDNNRKSEWDPEPVKFEFEQLKTDFDFEAFDFQLPDFAVNSKGDPDPDPIKLTERFLVPPFSVLDARQGYWQDRKRKWISMGIESEEGRENNLLGFSNMIREVGNTSIFDPVLCELIYIWFSLPGGSILDPFAGGSVRGIIASKLGREYNGIDLRSEQIEANKKQAEAMDLDPMPNWVVGDSMNVKELIKNKVDFVFSCPPYADLEVYSDNPKDLSTMKYEKFIEAYTEIIINSCSLLKDNRFACFVVGDIRDKKTGAYKNFPMHTIQAFEKAGLKLYNECVLVNMIGTLPLRVGKQFTHSRKLGKMHQNVLIFSKGDPVLATAELGDVEFEMSEPEK